MFCDEVERHLGDAVLTAAAELELAPDDNTRRQARFTAYHATRLARRLRGSARYWLDVRQAAEFQRGDFPLAELPPLAHPALFVEFNGLLRFNQPVRYYRTPAYAIPAGAPVDQLPPLTPLKEKSECLYRSVFIHEELPPHAAANYPAERVVSVQWYERLASRTLNVGGRTVSVTELDNYRLSFCASSWPRLLFEHHHSGTALAHAYRLFHMTVNLLYFLAAENLTFVRIRPEHHGRRELRGLPRAERPYHVLDFQLPGYRYAEQTATGVGTPHGHRYDVRGHFRHLRDDRYAQNSDGSARVLWVGAHQRGLVAATYRPQLRRGAVGARVLDYDELLMDLSSNEVKFGHK